MKVEDKDKLNWLGEFPSETFAGGKCLIIGSLGVSAAVETDDGLILFDIGTVHHGRRIFNEVRKFSDKPVKYIIYSHGHFDHCFGFKPFIDEIKEKGWDMPNIIGHENVIPRFKKYAMLEEYHEWINSMQFSSVTRKSGVSALETLDPTLIMYGKKPYIFKFGQFTFELFHDKGETDDSLWMFIPELKVLFTGDLYLWCYPNVGNPYKVQRYPRQWAIAMERMREKNAEFIVPGHGVLIKGSENVRECLSITAEAMHFVHDEVVKRLNEGKWFEQIYHEMLENYPVKFKESIYLKPIYGCYRFAIHATHRLYHGWYDSGNPTHLFPAKASEVAKELMNINSAEEYFNHAQKIAKEGKSQLALHILDIVINGINTPSQFLIDALKLKATTLKKIAKEEPSLIASNILHNETSQIRQKLREIRKQYN